MDAPILRFDHYNQLGPNRLTVGSCVALEITRGRVQQRIRPVRSRVFLIGTASDCDLVLGDLTFPEAYAYLFVQDDKVTIRRLGAGPDLIVCGERVETAELLADDRVAFGPFELRVIIDRPAERDSKAVEPGDPATLLLADLRSALAANQWPEDETANPYS